MLARQIMQHALVAGAKLAFFSSRKLRCQPAQGVDARHSRFLVVQKLGTEDFKLCVAAELLFEAILCRDGIGLRKLDCHVRYCLELLADFLLAFRGDSIAHYQDLAALACDLDRISQIRA